MTEPNYIPFTIMLGGDATAAESEVTVYRITEGAPEIITQMVIRDVHFVASVAAVDTPDFYAVARVLRVRRGEHEEPVGDRAVQLVAVFTGTATNVILNERSTVATAYAFTRFALAEPDGSVIVSDPNRARGIAYGMARNLVDVDGTVSRVLESPPNALQTNSWAMLNSLASLVYHCVVGPEAYAQFLELKQADSLFAALLGLPRRPFENVDAIYALTAERDQIFHPTLPSLEPPAKPVPNQWTLTVKVNDSGAENFLIGGVGYIVFDKNDRAWMANNVRQGTPNSSTFSVVLEPDGSPAPFSPIFGGGQLGAGFGIAVDRAGERIYVGNYGWGPTEWNPESGSISILSSEGEVLSPSNGYTAGLSRVQGMAVDADDNLWMSSWGSQLPMPPTDSRFNFEGENSAVVVYRKGDPERVLVYPFDNPYFLTFDVTVDDAGNAYASNSGYKGDSAAGIDAVPSSVYKLRIEGDQLCCVASWTSPNGYEAFRQVAIGPDGNVYVGAVATRRIIRLDPDLTNPTEISNEIHGPWGLVFDTEGTLFVANFLRDLFDDSAPTEPLGPHSVTVIRDLDEATAKVMTLPTGGHEVTLANGLPLYGNPQNSDGGDEPLRSFDPLMRLTATQIDRAGNLWACNNWKPSGVIDVKRGDPGGDGVVIFLGVAAPQLRT